jgi:hypothetical protein
VTYFFFDTTETEEHKKIDLDFIAHSKYTRKN